MKTVRRRRKENKTDYLKRLKLLKSEKPRIVFRRTNKYLLAQYVESAEAQDKVTVCSNTKDLLKYGWPKEAEGSLKSITAAYLLGILFGKKINSLETPIIDLGMVRIVHKTKPFAFMKGLLDAGIEISYKKEIFPEEERLLGKKLKNKIDFEKIKNNIEKQK